LYKHSPSKIYFQRREKKGETRIVTQFYVLRFQAEGSELSAELEFLDQQNIILSMENRPDTKWLNLLFRTVTPSFLFIVVTTIPLSFNFFN